MKDRTWEEDKTKNDDLTQVRHLNQAVPTMTINLQDNQDQKSEMLTSMQTDKEDSYKQNHSGKQNIKGRS